MIAAASSSFSGVISSPVSGEASNVMRVPPCRSSPSFGVQSLLRARPPYMASTASRKTISVRPCRDAFFAIMLLVVGTRGSEDGRAPWWSVVPTGAGRGVLRELGGRVVGCGLTVLVGRVLGQVADDGTAKPL